MEVPEYIVNRDQIYIGLVSDITDISRIAYYEALEYMKLVNMKLVKRQ